MISFINSPAFRAPVTFSHTDKGVSGTDTDTYTYTGKSIGAAAANRKVVVGIVSGTAGRTVSSVKAHVPNQASDPIGTSLTQVVGVTSAGGQIRSELWQAAIAAGTTADVVVVMSGSDARNGIDVLALYGAAAAAHDTKTSTADPPTNTISHPAGGVTVGVVGTQGDFGPQTCVWTNLTEKSDDTCEGNTTKSCAADALAAAQSLAVTATLAAGTVDRALVLASWAPG